VEGTEASGGTTFAQAVLANGIRWIRGWGRHCSDLPDFLSAKGSRIGLWEVVRLAQSNVALHNKALDDPPSLHREERLSGQYLTTLGGKRLRPYCPDDSFAFYTAKSITRTRSRT